MSKCDLYLENYQTHYTGGQTIIGHVLVTFTSDKEVHGIVVRIKGEATTHWTETESHYNSTTKRNESRTVSYNGSHVFINHEIDLLQNGGSSRFIREGVHKYPFIYTLPADLPSTFKEHLGKIQYKIKAVVKRPMLKFNYEAESPFMVVTPVDLNRNPSLRDPATRNKEKNTYFFCCNRGSIKVQANIPKTGLSIGERLPLHISVENLSQSNIECIKCKIKKDVEFHVTSPHHRTRHDKDTIYSENYSGVGAHGENTYNETIEINNAAIITNFVNCDVIKVSYMLEITFVLSGLHTNIELGMPLSLGHIPIGVRNTTMAAPPAYNMVNTATAPPVTPPTYGFVAPPDAMPMPVPMPMAMPVPPPYNDAASGFNFGGYPTAPMAPSAPDFTTAPAKSKDDWEVLDDPTNLPTYDQAMAYPTKT